MAYGVLNAKISAQIDEFERNMDRASGKLDDVGNAGERGGTKASKGLATLAKASGIASVAIGVVIKKIGDMVISSATALDRVDKLSQKIGLSRVAFQEWDYILGQSDASVEGLQMGIKTLSNAADEARKGTALYAEAFDKLGVSVTDANGNMKDQETLFAEVFSALADMENQTERTALANKLLGRSATELAPALNTSKEAIEGLRQEAHDLGLVYSDELVDAGVALGDNIDRLKKSFGAWRTEALTPVIGVMVSLSSKILGQNTEIKKLETSTDNLVRASADYETIVDLLTGKVNDLTEEEKGLLEARKNLLALKIKEEFFYIIESYDKTNNKLKELITTQNELEKQSKVQSLALTDRASAEARLDELSEIRVKTLDELSEQMELRNALTLDSVTLSKQHIATEKELGQVTENITTIEGRRTASIHELSKAVADSTLDISAYENVNKELYDRIIAGADAYKRDAEQRKKANAEFATWSNYTKAQLIDAKTSIELNEKNAYSIELLSLVNARLNDILAENAKKTEDANEKDRIRNEILENSTTAMQTAEQYASALGDSFNLNAEKASILETAIKALIDSGLDPASGEVQGLIDKLTALGSAMETPTGGGEDDPEDTGTYYEDELDRLSDFLASEQELLFKRFSDRKALLDEALAKEKMSKQEHDEMMKGLEEQYQGELTDIQKKAQEERNQLMLNAGTMMANNLISIYSNIVDATEKEGKRNFQLQKAASIAQAVVDGISAGISSYKAGAAIGGPVVGAAFAATSAAATGAMIAKLASASYGGGPSSANVPAPSTPAVQSQQTLLVQGDFDSSQLFSGSAVRDLIDKIGQAQKDGYTVVMA